MRNNEEITELFKRREAQINSIGYSLVKLSELLHLSIDETKELFQPALDGIVSNIGFVDPSQPDFFKKLLNTETLQQANTTGKITASNLSFLTLFLETLLKPVNNQNSKEDILKKVPEIFEQWMSSDTDRATDTLRTSPQTLLRLKNFFLLLSKNIDKNSLNEQQKQALANIISITEQILNGTNPQSVPGHAPTGAEQGLFTKGDPAQVALSA